ncbi:Rne/Rng family ribonuclease, partial [Aeromicrobium sp.]|uniref:Rne/Rng family ribonuclease n=1 Tax=Aeromicrobium sp. TaxID=1871063 RepID=UPI0025BBE5F4
GRAPPARRGRRAPAKRAPPAPRKRPAKAPAETVPVEPAPGEPAPAEEVPLTEEELAAQAALLQAGPVVVPQDPTVVDDISGQDISVEDISVDAPSSLVTDDVPAPVKRTRARRPAAMTFQAPEPVAPAPAAPAPAAHADPFAPLDDEADAAPAPRRRRRAGTSGAGAPGALVPELIEPVASGESPAGERPAASDDDEDDDRPRRRRRGRRGRGPRAEGEESTDSDDRTDAPTSDASPSDAEADEDDGDGATGTRRRRRRRRTGADDGVGEAPAAAPVREPRAPRNRSQGGGGTGATSADEDGVRGITGSTRMAAKRVRRQEGRDSGRTRKPILSEAEFLARREAVDRTMVVRQKGDRTQIAVLEDGVLVEHYVTKASAQAYAGNVYLGRVQNVLPSMEAAFVDIGKSRNAVLYAGEVNYNASVGGRSRSIGSVLKSGQEVLGQVSLPGRYLVYVPNGSMNGISRKLPDTERARLKKILKEVLPENVGVIVRTAAEGATDEQLTLDVNRLTAQWAAISATLETVQAPALLHSEPDLLVKIVRDVFNEDFHELVIDGEDAEATIKTYLSQVAPDLVDRLKTYEGTVDSFDEYRITEQIEKALDRKVWLPSGGSLVIDRTEAMTVVDVNTGKFVGSGGNLEETVTKNNLESAEEIVRQLRLRDIGGIIVVDFIDMVLESNRDLVLRRLVECLSRDRTKHQVAEVTSLGLVQMTRKKLGLGLIESFSEPCEFCAGRGIIIHHDPVVRHRQSAQPETPRRGRGKGGNGNGGNDSGRSNGSSNNGSSAAQKPNGGTHAITDDVKNALAQIAASTIAHAHVDEPAVVASDAPAKDVTASAVAVESAPVAAVESPQVEAVTIAAAEAAVEILDIPVKKNSRGPRRISTHDAEQILDSVLDALPEPKQPGQGRSRVSRRASSAGTVRTTEQPEQSEQSEQSKGSAQE